MSWSERHGDAAFAWGGAEDPWDVLSGGEHRQDQLWPLHHRGNPQQSVSLQFSVPHRCRVPRSLILSVSVTSCSRSGAVHRCGEAPDDAMSVWGLWTCAVSAGECLHPHVLPQRWGNFQEMSFQSCLSWCVSILHHASVSVPQYFRHLLWGAESPARNSKLNRYVFLCVCVSCC